MSGRLHYIAGLGFVEGPGGRALGDDSLVMMISGVGAESLGTPALAPWMIGRPMDQPVTAGQQARLILEGTNDSVRAHLEAIRPLREAAERVFKNRETAGRPVDVISDLARRAADEAMAACERAERVRRLVALDPPAVGPVAEEADRLCVEAQRLAAETRQLILITARAIGDPSVPVEPSEILEPGPSRGRRMWLFIGAAAIVGLGLLAFLRRRPAPS